LDGPAEIVDYGSEGEGGAETGRSDEVVPAGVPEFGERVILGQIGQRRPLLRAGVRCPEGCLEPADGLLDAETGISGCLGEPAGRLVLLELDLGMLMDLPGQFYEGGPHIVQGRKY
jgi:hypothetical protein